MKQSIAAAKRRARHRMMAIGLMVLISAFVVAVGSYMYLSRAPRLDGRLCPVKGPAGQIVLLVDKTDPLDFTQKQAFQNSLNQLVSVGVPAGYLLSVFVLGEDYKATAQPIFDECNPGDGSGASEFDSNPARLKKRFEQGFRAPMLKLLDELQGKQSARYSPIFEMLELTSINGFRKENVNGPRRLIIVSDMLHNTPEYSMYKGTPDFEHFHESDYGRKMSTDFNGVEVSIQYLINTPQLQTRRHLKFWEDYFAASGGRLVAVRPVEG